MATKTVVCPECGAPVMPGRYACAECGSLLAAVTATARSWVSEPEPEPEPEPLAASAFEATLPTEAAAGEAPAPEPAPAAEAAAAPPVTEPDVLHGWTPHEGARTEPAWAEELTPDPDPEPARPDEPAAPPPDQPLAQSTPATWPPPGDRGVDPTPTARTPAGAYLPPSAVLEALDPASATGSTAGAVLAPSAGALAASSGRSSPSVTLRGLLGSIDLAEDTPRAIIAVGAAIAAIGFLLPWANVLAGAGLLGGYFTQWGLAGPGHWIALTVLVATVGVALAGPPTARWPVGLGAVALATLLVGMLWPYLFGFLGRSIGVWVVLAGAIVLAIGGVLDRLDRHDPEGPAVP